MPVILATQEAEIRRPDQAKSSPYFSCIIKGDPVIKVATVCFSNSRNLMNKNKTDHLLKHSHRNHLTDVKTYKVKIAGSTSRNFKKHHRESDFHVSFSLVFVRSSRKQINMTEAD
jgi:hypothetical protein